MKSMFKHTSILILIFFFVSCQQKKYHINGFAQGSTYHITYINHSEKQSLKKSIDSIINIIDQSMSTYKSNSLITQINQNKTQQTDFHFRQVLKTSKQIWEQTDGYFDPSIGTLFNLWGFGEQKNTKIPTQQQIDSIIKISGMHQFHLNDKNELIKNNTQVHLNFNAIAQGYTCDVIANFFKNKNIQNFIIELGGELFISGKNTINKTNWNIGIDDPLSAQTDRKIIKIISKTNCGIATSGNYRKVRTDSLSGKKYVHTINPKTGYPKESNLLSATVIASSSMLSDAYATSLMAMGLEKSIIFLKKHPEIEALLFYTEDKIPNEIRVFSSGNFN